MPTRDRSHRDLSHALDADAWTYPGDPPVSVEPHATVEDDGYRVSALALGTHAGTHLDAPSHTEPDGATVDQLPLETFSFDAALVRLDGELGPREPIRPDHLPRDPDGPNPDDHDLLVLDTGWASHWGTERYVDHPYLAEAAAEWCAERDLSVAIDAPSVDPSPSERAAEGEPADHPAHRALLGAGLVIVENLTDLDGLPDRFELRAYPLPIAGVDGSPVRAVAVF